VAPPGYRKPIETVTCRQSTAADGQRAQAAADLIASASGEFDIAPRPKAFLDARIESGRAALALADHDLVGCGYFSAWEDGRFVSHSGLVVKPDYRGHGLGRQLKMVLFNASQQEFPRAVLISLTNSIQVKAMNLKLGYEVVSMEQLTTDAGFWEGCKKCRNYAQTRANRLRCCCEAMALKPK
jgi:GNAT superfamily N-acetyltransferase